MVSDKIANAFYDENWVEFERLTGFKPKSHNDAEQYMNNIVNRCRVCGLGFTQMDLDNASKGVVGDECLVGDYDDICYPCQFKESDKHE